MIRVVKVNRQQNNFTRYMGRTWAGLSESPYHNPFHVGRDGSREEVLLKFILYWYAEPQRELRQRAVREIGPDDVLGCWCHPLTCHCDIIAGYVAWRDAGQLWL